MPSSHGDPSTPYYDLPAGNLVPHIIPNSTVPLRPESIKPLQFLAGPADEKLVTALKVFMKDVDQIYEPGKPQPQNDDEVVDIDELGQPVIRDTVTGEILNGETYYGWSRTFCEQMKKRNTKGADRSRSRSWSRSASGSRSPPVRRRYSGSPYSDDSLSRSRSPGSRRGGLGGQSYSRSRSPPRRPSPSRERSYSPPAPSAQKSFPPPYKRKEFPSAAPPPPPGIPPPPPMNQHHFAPGSAPPPPPSMHNAGMMPHSSAPPLPPPNYQGPWPPPPPPMPGMPGMNFTPGQAPTPPGMNPAAFLPLQGGGHFPPVHLGGAQQLPPGSFRFPPPHSGSSSGPGAGAGAGYGWGQSGGRGRGWR